MVCTGCCATLDHIVTYLFKKVTNKGNQLVLRSKSVSIISCNSEGKKSRSNNPSSGDNDSLVAVVKMRPEILQQMLQTVLNIIMFEDCRNQWSMSRPLLGLILLNEEYFQVAFLSMRKQKQRISFLFLEFAGPGYLLPADRQARGHDDLV